MAREAYVRPVTDAREPVSRSIAVWRFRLLALVVLALAVLLVVTIFNRINGANRQDPSFEPGALSSLRR